MLLLGHGRRHWSRSSGRSTRCRSAPPTACSRSCSHGVAASLVCERMTTEAITAIDRSPKLIEMATRRNCEYVDVGRAALEAVALADADLGDRRFDKVFAVNLAPF